MVIELRGVQFGLKSYARFQIWNERAARARFEITRMKLNYHFITSTFEISQFNSPNTVFVSQVPIFC